MVTQRAEREVRILCDHELLDLTWSRYAAGERGPDPHVHERHADAFYVLEGELMFDLGPELETITASAGTLVLVPAGVVHSFRNDGPGEARYLNVHAPSCGFADSLRGLAGFDTHDPPPDGGLPLSNVVVRRRGEGETLALGPHGLELKAQVGDGDGTFYLGEMRLAPGFAGPVPHRHERHLDSFFVLDGTLTVRLGAEEVEATPGSYAVAPPGSVHTFSNRSEGTVRALNLMAPGGFEQYLKEAAAAAAATPEELARIAARYDFVPV